MEYTKLGKTDIEVSKLCVGCMSFGKAGTMHDWTLDESATEAVSDTLLTSASISSTRPTAILRAPAKNIWEKR